MRFFVASELSHMKWLKMIKFSRGEIYTKKQKTKKQKTKKATKNKCILRVMYIQSNRYDHVVVFKFLYMKKSI